MNKLITKIPRSEMKEYFATIAHKIIKEDSDSGVKILNSMSMSYDDFLENVDIKLPHDIYLFKTTTRFQD